MIDLHSWPSIPMPTDRHDEVARRPDGHRGALVTSLSPRGDRLTGLRIARVLGAIALLVVGGVHLEQYAVAHFSVIPTIGPLFLVNFLAATILGLVLLAPVRGTFRPRRLVFDSLAALAGLGVAAGAMAGLLISEQTPLFGFIEHGYRLEIVIALAAETVAIVSLGVFLACAHRGPRRLPEGPVVPEVSEGALRASAARAATEAQ
jgi:hypothetical protein